MWPILAYIWSLGVLHGSVSVFSHTLYSLISNNANINIHAKDNSFKYAISKEQKKKKDIRQLFTWNLYQSCDKFVNIAMERPMFGLVLLLIYYIYCYRSMDILFTWKIFLWNKKFSMLIKCGTNERKEGNNVAIIQIIKLNFILRSSKFSINQVVNK